MRFYRAYASCVLLLCGVLLMPTGCKEDTSATGGSGSQKPTEVKEYKKVKSAASQDTPQGTIKKWAAAFRANNLDDYLDTIQCTEVQKEYVVAMLGQNVTCELQQALLEKFGGNAWAELQGVDVSPEFGASFTYTVPPPHDQWQEDLEVDITGNRATWLCTWGRRPEKYKLVFDEKQEAWFLLLPGMPEDPKSMYYMCELVNKLSQAAKAGLKAVDEPDITIREIKLRMGDDFFQRPRMEVEPEPEPELVPEADPDLEKEAEIDPLPEKKTESKPEPKTPKKVEKVSGTTTGESE